MKILVIGDLHGKLPKNLPKKDIDLILLVGDIGKADLMRKMAFGNIKRRRKGIPDKEHSHFQEKKAFMEAYNSTIRIIKILKNIAPVYTIFGNVESSNSETIKKSKEIGLSLPFLFNKLNSMRNIRIINQRIAKFNGVRIGGIEYFRDYGWLKEFEPDLLEERGKKSKKETERARKVLKWFGKVDILLCHQPAYRVLDKVSAKFTPKDWKGKNAGSRVLLDYIKKYQPNYFICGHIHEAKGERRIGKTKVYNLGMGRYRIIDIE